MYHYNSISILEESKLHFSPHQNGSGRPSETLLFTPYNSSMEDAFYYHPIL